MSWKPKAQIEREKLEKRGKDYTALANNIVPDNLRKTPSQRHSESIRKKLRRGSAKVDLPIQDDCRDCERHPCGKTLNGCDKPSRRNVCKNCGQKVHYRVIEGVEWDCLCPVCRSRL